MLAPARLRAFLSISIIVEGVTRSIHEALGSSYNGFVFVAYDGGFLCRTCVESPCTEMVAATCDYDESELPIECGQWCIVGAQDPELGHGDTCDHCGGCTMAKPDDVDNYLDPWPLLDKVARRSPNLDPRAYGGDRNGPTDCDSGAVDAAIPEKCPGGKPRLVPIDMRTTSLFINVVGKVCIIAPDVDDADEYTPSPADCEGLS